MLLTLYIDTILYQQAINKKAIPEREGLSKVNEFSLFLRSEQF
jgi:hypothetical protein